MLLQAVQETLCKCHVVQVFVRESSMVPVYSILLFGGEIDVIHERGLIKVRSFNSDSVWHSPCCEEPLHPGLGHDMPEVFCSMLLVRQCCLS